MGYAGYYLSVAIVTLAPLLLGGHRDWAWSFLAAATGVAVLLLVFHLLRNDAKRHADLITGLWPAVVLAAIVLSVIGLQVVQIGSSNWGASIWHDASQALLVELPASISTDRQETLTGLMKLLMYFSIFGIAAWGGASSRRAEHVLWVVVCVTAAYSAYGLMVKFSGVETIIGVEKWASRGSVTSTFVNRNHFANYAAIGLCCAVALTVRIIDRNSRSGNNHRARVRNIIENVFGLGGIAIVAGLVCVTALLLSQSRGGVLSAAVAVPVLVGGVLWCRNASLIQIFICGVAASAPVIYLIDMFGSKVASRFGSSSLEGMQRDEIYSVTFNIAVENFWSGTGLGTFENVFRVYRPSDILMNWDFAHNTYLETVMELGFPAGIALILVVAWPGLGCARTLWKRRRGGVFAALGVSIMVIEGVHSAFDFSMQIPAIAMTYALLLGTAWAQSHRIDRS